MTTDTTGELAKALAALQAEMPVVPKASKAMIPGKNGGAGYSYTYANLANVTEIAYPLLAKHGLSFACCPEVHESGAIIAGLLLHTSGESLTASLPLFGRTAQEIGSALTYARRYLLGCMTGLVTDDDDDGSLAEKARRTEVPMTDKTRRQMFALFGRKGIAEEAQLSGINQITGSAYESRGDVTEADAQRVIAVLNQRPDVTQEAS